jgi:uncharacterized protein YegP (UPF0339 family)
MKFEIHREEGTGKYWVRLADDKNEPLAHSHFHDDKAAAEHSVRVLKAEAATALVVDLTGQDQPS